MHCNKVTTSRAQLLDPAAAGWGSIAGEEIKLDATPLANQPSEYIKASRDEKKIGKVRKLKVQVAHNGSDIFFRLEWEDDTENITITDNNEFPDGCGVLLPLTSGEPPIDEMGSKDDPVNAWFWRADFEDKPRNTVAEGLSSTLWTEKCAVEAKSARLSDGWAVVFARSLEVAEQPKENVRLAPGTAVKVGFAVWEGSNGERAGVKSFSKEWRELTLDA